MTSSDRTPPFRAWSEELLGHARAQGRARRAEAEARHDRFMGFVDADRRSRAARAAQMVSVVVLAVLAGSGRRGPGGPGSRPHFRRRPKAGPGGHPLPQPIRPDHPNGLSGGAAAELTFDD